MAIPEGAEEGAQDPLGMGATFSGLRRVGALVESQTATAAPKWPSSELREDDRHKALTRGSTHIGGGALRAV